MDNMFNSQRTETEEWLLTEYSSHRIIGLMEQKPVANQFFESQWPFLSPYYSPLNAIFSPFYPSVLTNEGKLDAVPGGTARTIMLRDGIVPLSWFFQNHSVESMRDRFLVHADLAGLVPGKWRHKVKLYRHQSAVSGKSPEALFMAGPVNERVLDLDGLDRTLDRIEAAIGKRRMATIKVHLYCPIRNDGEGFPARYLQKIFQRLRNTTVIDLFKIENTPSFKNFAYVELNEGWLFQDSYIQQHVLSRGAALLFQTSGPVEKNSVPLSPFHGVHISKLGAKDCLSEEQDAKLESFFRQVSEYVQKESEEGLWPAWHEKRCHATVRMKCNG